MAFPAILSLSPSYPILHFQFNHKKSLASRARRLNSHSMIVRSSLADNNASLLQAAKHTVDSYIRSGMVIGLGSGNASSLAIKYIGQQLRAGALKELVGIPTSVGSASEAAKAGIPLNQYQDSSQIDFAFNDADVIEERTLSAIIGRQSEESIVQEKTVLKVAEKLVFMILEKQYRSSSDGSIPVLINSFNWLETAEEIDDLFLGDAEVWRRSSIGHAGPLGGDFPLVTRDGHNVLDLIFTSPIADLAGVAESLDEIDGVVEHGVIAKTPCTVVIATESGLRIVDNTVRNEEKCYASRGSGRDVRHASWVTGWTR